MTPPPSATAHPSSQYGSEFADFDIGAHLMVEDTRLSPADAVRRAFGGLAMSGLGALLLAVTLSWSPFDSTRDTAGLGQTRNWLGGPGAEFANILMQGLGWGAIFLALLVLHHGAMSLARPRPRGTRMARTKRFGLVAGTVLFGAATLSGLPIPQDWALSAGLGGMIGDAVFLTLSGWLHALNIPLAGALSTLFLFTIAAFGLARILGMVKEDLFDTLDAALIVWAHIRVYFDRFAGWLARRFSKAYAEPIMATDTLVRDVPDTLAGEATHQAPQPAAPAPAPVVIKAPAPSPKPKPKPKKKPKPETFHFEDGADFVLPQVDLLKVPPPRTATADPAMLARMSEHLHRVLGDFKVDGEMGAVSPGPVVTLYEFEPAPGVKSSRVTNLSDDIARNMEVASARIAVVPGKNAMGIELPNKRRQTVWLRTMLESDAFQNSDAALPLILGEDIGGAPFIADLAKMPHLLVAGTTGSGKSVGVNAMILSLMYRYTPDECKFIMIDPKMLELSVYDEVPHLLAPVVTEPKKAVVALKWTVREMEDRYRKMAKFNVRNMRAFNEKLAESKANGEEMSRTVMTGYNKETGEPEYETEQLEFEPMPFIVVIIDEMADLMMVAGKDIEGSVQRLAQMARAAGIHVVMATQRPSTDVITGTIKSNFPAKIAFRVGSKIDSRVILGEMGGETLLGNGDMLYAGTGRPRRLHGPFVSDAEVERIANFLKAQGMPSYVDSITADEDEDMPADAMGGDEDLPLFDQAVAIVARDRKATTSYIQRKLGIGYNKAANLIEQMEQEQMIGPSGPGGKREIFLPE